MNDYDWPMELPPAAPSTVEWLAEHLITLARTDVAELTADQYAAIVRDFAPIIDHCEDGFRGPWAEYMRLIGGARNMNDYANVVLACEDRPIFRP